MDIATSGQGGAGTPSRIAAEAGRDPPANAPMAIGRDLR
jgi:hypothetical protein